MLVQVLDGVKCFAIVEHTIEECLEFPCIERKASSRVVESEQGCRLEEGVCLLL